MSTKTFKIGEGTNSKIKLTTGKEGVYIQQFKWDGKENESMHFFLAMKKFYDYDNLNHLELDFMKFVSNYHADKIMTWILTTKEYNASFKFVNC